MKPNEQPITFEQLCELIPDPPVSPILDPWSVGMSHSDIIQRLINDGHFVSFDGQAYASEIEHAPGPRIPIPVDETPITFDEVCNTIPDPIPYGIVAPSTADELNNMGRADAIRSLLRYHSMPSHHAGTVFYASEIATFNAIQAASGAIIGDAASYCEASWAAQENPTDPNTAALATATNKFQSHLTDPQIPGWFGELDEP